MVPTIFVSSTVKDLSFLREMVRDSIEGLGYRVVMSEFGDVPYPALISVEDACYKAIQTCQLAVLIIGKHYGTPGRDGLSVTHNEARVARGLRIPLITFVDSEVLALRNANNSSRPTISATGKRRKKAKASLSKKDDYASIFAFIDEITSSERNNAIQRFSSGKEVCELLKKQFAYMMFDAIQAIKARM